MKILLKLKNAKPMVIEGEDLSYNHGYVFEGSVKQVINFNLDKFEYIIWDQDKVQEYLTEAKDVQDELSKIRKAYNSAVLDKEIDRLKDTGLEGGRY